MVLAVIGSFIVVVVLVDIEDIYIEAVFCLWCSVIVITLFKLCGHVKITENNISEDLHHSL